MNQSKESFPSEPVDMIPNKSDIKPLKNSSSSKLIKNQELSPISQSVTFTHIKPRGASGRGSSSKITPEVVLKAQAMFKDRRGLKFVADELEITMYYAGLIRDGKIVVDSE